MSVTAVSGGQNGELRSLLESLNDVGVLSVGPAMTYVSFHITVQKMGVWLSVRPENLGSLIINLKFNESLYERIISKVPILDWHGLENCDFEILRSWRMLCVTNARTELHVKNQLDRSAQEAFYLTLRHPVHLTLYVKSSSQIHLFEEQNNGGIHEHWELGAAQHVTSDQESENLNIRRECQQCASCDFTIGTFTLNKEWWHEKRFWDRGSILHFRMFYICNIMSLYARLAPLHYFHMTDIQITSGDLLRLLQGLRRHTLFRLSLQNLNLDDHGAIVFLEVLMQNANDGQNWSNLQEISLQGNTRISATVKENILREWTAVYGSRNAGLSHPRFFLKMD